MIVYHGSYTEIDIIDINELEATDRLLKQELK